MSVELATEKYLDGKGEGLLGQFASNKGYSDLIAAAKKYPAFEKFVEDGATENVGPVCKDLEKMAASAPDDVASTAAALLKLMRGKKFVMIARGI